MNHLNTRPGTAWILPMLLLTGPAVAQTAERDWPLANQFMVEGQLSVGVEALAQRVAAAPDDDQQARFGLGAVQFLHAVETLSQSLYRYGVLDTGPAQELPFLRTVMAANPDPEPVDADEIRQVISQFVDQLVVAESTLAEVQGEVDLPLQFGLVRLDLTGDGEPDVALWEIYAAVTGVPLDADEAAQFVIDFDTADVYWLRGYCHVLMAICETTLAYDFRELIERTGHLLFAQPRTPHTWLHAEDRDANMGVFDMITIFDVIAFVHLLNLPLVEPQRMEAALSHLEQVPPLSRQNWEQILAETDDRNEWIPGPAQTGVIPGVEVTEAMVDQWMAFLDEAEAILAGHTLLPFWRGSDPELGVNARRVFTEPAAMDLVLWIQGTAATPYLERGNVTDPDFWERLNEVFQGQFVGFAIWFN